jgi:hypothetical protein
MLSSVWQPLKWTRAAMATVSGRIRRIQKGSLKRRGMVAIIGRMVTKWLGKKMAGASTDTNE